ncbi:flagellar transcriptional regulator FlhD [Caballeronia sp. DA-9]|uniref:flagellar transcriptional regulator FlhD n=1 Tax=Caballeronia sp. DA-9 TaxID=3436237 RepID=UPI003F6728CE
MTFANDSADSIREINLSYVLLAQKMLRSDRAVGEARLGLSGQVADILIDLSMAQVVKLAAAPHLLCAFRFDDQSMLSSLSREDGHRKAEPAESLLSLTH